LISSAESISAELRWPNQFPHDFTASNSAGQLERNQGSESMTRNKSCKMYWDSAWPMPATRDGRHSEKNNSIRELSPHCAQVEQFARERGSGG
jgi:hypothetical protein